MISNKAAKQYYKSIYRSFPTHSQQEKRFFKLLKKDLDDFEKQHPEYQYHDYIEHYGKPVDIVCAYYEHFESEFIINHMKSRKIIKCAMIIFITVFLAVSTYVIYTFYCAFHDFKDSQIQYEETIIEDFGEHIDE